ncbi:hypothetical protein NG798_14895 [Ancylothrix sp. C2]|uniref:hypothetical protein n=1 Tax=Ancylothrix sp. D3o TaxID=2953691 RepID=UPI0021BB0B82|nr:hypothetical protein [Ancylothrix sp. D3o]MCT7951084.1 hypothetical protein [Ancylothrix sp. D3o]
MPKFLNSNVFGLGLITFLSLVNTYPIQAGTTSPLNPPQKISQSQAKVKVFFPKLPNSNNNLNYVEPVWRTTTSRSVAEFAIQQLIAGPNSSEKSKGLIAPLKLQGNSNCGKDFTISIIQGVARLKFCRPVLSAGIGDDARMKSSIEATLKQFPTVKSTIITTHKGDCLGDMSGENFCLKKPQ